MNFLFVFVALILYAYNFRRDIYKKYFSLFASCLILFSFADIINIDFKYLQCINLGILTYLGALISSLINRESKELFITIYSIIILLSNMFTNEILIGIVICFISMFLIIYGFIKDFKKIKISAIILFILNLIYMLRDFWSDIPLAIYLLLIGLILIGVVIIKEIKENK